MTVIPGYRQQPDVLAAAAATIGCHLSCPHITTGNVPQPDPAVVLVTNNSTDSRWWQHLAEHSRAQCLIRGRLQWKSTLQGQIALYFGDDPEAFRAAFAQFGATSRWAA